MVLGQAYIQEQSIGSYPLDKITSRGSPEDIPEIRPDVLETFPYGPICNTMGGFVDAPAVGRLWEVLRTET